jgi:hypothetical protein
VKLTFQALSSEHVSPLLPRSMQAHALANQDVQEVLGMVVVVILEGSGSFQFARQKGCFFPHKQSDVFPLPLMCTRRQLQVNLQTTIHCVHV